jgi:hypothetical protein
MANQLISRIYTVGELTQLGVPADVADDYINIAANFKIVCTQFQALKSGAQATTGAFAPLAGWTQERNYSGFTFDTASGELTIPATGVYSLDASVYGDANTGLEMKAELYAGGVWGDIAAAIDGNPSSAHINGFQFNASVSQLVRLSVKDTGGAQSIATNRARMSVRRIA